MSASTRIRTAPATHPESCYGFVVDGPVSTDTPVEVVVAELDAARDAFLALTDQAYYAEIRLEGEVERLTAERDEIAAERSDLRAELTDCVAERRDLREECAILSCEYDAMRAEFKRLLRELHELQASIDSFRG